MELKEVVLHVGRTKMENGQEKPTINMTTTKQNEFKMKTSKRHILIKYVVLFFIILVAVVLSTVVAGYVGTRSLVGDIPNQVKEDLLKMPEWKILDSLPSNLTQMKHALQHDLKNETRTASEWLFHRFLNETDFLPENKDINRKIYTMIHSLVCVNNCIGRVDGNYQSCYTCHGYVTCIGGSLVNRTCPMFLENKYLLWDNLKRYCDVISSTCDPDYLPL